jgi:hypothetical protein
VGIQQYLATSSPAANSTTVENADQAADREFQDAFEQEFEYDAQFNQELQMTREEVLQSERGSVFESLGDDPWSREVESLRRDIANIEANQGLPSFNQE